MKLNKRELAECFGVAEETITQWMAAGCPVVSLARGTKGNVYDTAEIFRWRVARDDDRNKDALDFQAERTRLTKAQADKTELEVAELAGELIRTEDVMTAWGDRIAAARARLMALPSKIAHRIAPPGRTAEAQALAQEAIYEALNELASNGLPDRAAARRDAGERHLAGPTGSVDKPVGGSVPKAKRRGQRGKGQLADGDG